MGEPSGLSTADQNVGFSVSITGLEGMVNIVTVDEVDDWKKVL